MGIGEREGLSIRPAGPDQPVGPRDAALSGSSSSSPCPGRPRQLACGDHLRPRTPPACPDQAPAVCSSGEFPQFTGESDQGSVLVVTGVQEGDVRASQPSGGPECRGKKTSSTARWE